MRSIRKQFAGRKHKLAFRSGKRKLDSVLNPEIVMTGEFRYNVLRKLSPEQKKNLFKSIPASGGKVWFDIDAKKVTEAARGRPEISKKIIEKYGALSAQGFRQFDPKRNERPQFKSMSEVLSNIKANAKPNRKRK